MLTCFFGLSARLLIRVGKPFFSRSYRISTPPAIAFLYKSAVLHHLGEQPLDGFLATTRDTCGKVFNHAGSLLFEHGKDVLLTFLFYTGERLLGNNFPLNPANGRSRYVCFFVKDIVLYIMSFIYVLLIVLPFQPFKIRQSADE